MELLLRLSRGIDRLTAAVGRLVSWLALVMILIGAYNAVVRYLGRFIGVRLSSNMYIELQWYLFSLLFLLAASWALQEEAHVRVDVLYARLSGRGRALIDLVGSLLLLLPFSIFALWVSIPSIQNSWKVREMSPDPGGLPRYPLKTVILVSFALLALQGISELIKALQRLRTPEPAPSDGHAGGAT